jgi:hypothetical protein
LLEALIPLGVFKFLVMLIPIGTTLLLSPLGDAAFQLPEVLFGGCFWLFRGCFCTNSSREERLPI